MFLSQSGHMFHEATSLLQDRKFDTALRRSTVEAFIERKDKEHHWSDDLIWKHHPEADKYLCDTTLLPQLIMSFLVPSSNSYKGRLRTWQRMWEIIEQNILIQHTWISQTFGPDISKHNDLVIQLFKHANNQPIISTLLSVVDDFNEIINKLPDINTYLKGNLTNDQILEKKLKVNQYECNNLKMKLTWNQKIVIIEWRRNKWILPKPFVLQIHNKLADLVSCLLYSSLTSGIQHPENFYLTVIDFIVLNCQFHVQHPSLYFDFAKSLEGICVGILLAKTEDWVNDALLNNLIGELNLLYFQNMRHHPIIQLLLEVPIDVLTELSCLTKLTGHPLTEIKQGAEKLYKRVTEELPISVNAISFCISTFKENFVRNFIFKYNRWPMVEFNHSVAHPAIIYCYPRGLDPLSKDIISRFGKLRWEDWANITLQPEMKFNYCDNIIPLLKDKALSIMRSKVISSFIEKKMNPSLSTKAGSKTSFKETRVILHYLFSSEMETDHIDYINKFTSCTEDLQMVLDYLVIRLVPKEKELKTMPRFFGCKTFVDRARTIVQEQNLATFLSLFSDEQGMTLSELALIRKLYSIQNMSNIYKTHKVFKISLDASGWNSRQRGEANKPFAINTLDRIFDTNLFSRTHDAYENSLVYIPDELDTHWWDGQQGGIEGLNQNQWVILYAAEMKYAFKDTAYPFFQLIHGDDYRAGVAIPLNAIPPGQEEEIVKDLMTRLSNAATVFGHDLKVEESYASENLLCYSKIIFYKTIQLPSALRKIQKTYGATNAFLPILDDYVGSTFSNSHSACYTTVSHYAPYIVALFWTSYYLLHTPHYKSCSHSELVAMTLTPSSVGGLPIIYLHNMFVRGESDLLTTFINLVQHCKQYFRSVAVHMEPFLCIPPSATKPYALLLKDPYSLPIKKPQSISQYLKNITRKRLCRNVQNSNVRDLLYSYNRPALETLLTTLKSCNEWQAKPFTALYSSSPFHLVDELLSSFVTAKSIMDLLILSSRNIAQSQRILAQAIKKDAKLHEWRIRVMRRQVPLLNREIDPRHCPSVIAQNMRNEMWELNVTTITHPPPQHQVMFTTSVLGSRSDWALDNHFLLTLHDPNFLIENDRWHYSDGGKDPFLGYATSAGVITPTIRVGEKDPVASKVSNLLTLRSWMNKSLVLPYGVIESNFAEIIDKMLNCYTDVPANQLQKFAPMWKSGSITHRLRAHGFREAIVPNNLLNLYTLVTGETNTHRHFRETRDDFTINYLHLFCYGTNVMLLDLELRGFHTGPTQVWMVTTNCENCNLPIIEPPIRYGEHDYLLSDQPKIKMTELGAAALQMINLAQAEYDIQYPTINNLREQDADLNISRATVIYECLKKSWEEKVVLSKRYGIHDMSSRGVGYLSGLVSLHREKMMGETELRALPINNVIDVMSTYILHFFLRETDNPYETNINARYNTIIASHLPWYTLMEWYYKAGLLRQFIKEVNVLTNVPPHEGCYYNINTATIYVGKCLTSYALTSPPIFNHIPCTLHDTQETLYKRYVTFYTRALFTDMKVHHNECHAIFSDQRNADITPDMIDHVLKAYIKYCRDPMSIEDFTENAPHEQGSFAFIIQKTDMPSDEEWMKWSIEPLGGILAHFNYLHGGKMYFCLSQCDDDMVNEAVEMEDDTFIQENYNISRFPIGFCIDIVRSNPYIIDKITPPDPLDAHNLEQDIGFIQNFDREDISVTLPEAQTLVMTFPQIHNDFPSFDPIFVNYPWSCFTRYLGASISSCNKYHYILSDLELFNNQQQEGWIYCVGEGEGGTLHYLLKMFPNCLGIFNTLIDDQRSGASAGICDRDPQTSHRYAKHPLKQGISDLTKIETIQVYLQRYVQRGWLMTCDADIRKASPTDAFHLWNNVVTWWLQRRTQNGVLIIKVFFRFFAELCRVLTRLSFYAIHVKLYRPPHCHTNQELFIVAWGTLHNLEIQDPHETGIEPNIMDTTANFCLIHQETYDLRTTGFDPNYARAMINAHKLHRESYDETWGLLMYIITQKARLPLHHLYRPYVSRSRVIIDTLQNDILSEQEDTIKRLRGVEKELKSSFVATDHLRHKVILVERYLYLGVMQSLLTVGCFESLYREVDDLIDPEILMAQLGPLALQLPDIPARVVDNILMIGAYSIDLSAITYKASGLCLQLLGVFCARENYLMQYAGQEVVEENIGPEELYEEDNDLLRLF